MTDVLAPLFDRLRADGGRYLLSVALTSEEFAAQPEPTFGGKGHKRWLTDEEYAALCALPTGVPVISADHEARILAAFALIHSYGGIDGGHHKQWVLDQVVRVLAPDYEAWVTEHKAGKDGPETYDWDVGIPP